jgi:predicted nucleic acid-binding protein
MAKAAVFLDTSGFYAWLSSDDAHHRKAVRFLTTTDRPLVTTDWVIGETCNLLIARRAPRLVRILFEALDRSVSIHQTTVGAERFEQARGLFIKYEDHAFPLTDCTSFVVMREMGLKDALTADRHFRTMGFNPLLAG